MSGEVFSYGTIGEEQTQRVIEAYVDVRSCLAASMQEGVFVSVATVSRIIRAAVENGVMSEGVKRSSGRPGDKRENAKRVVSLYSQKDGYSRKEQAVTAGCSESTVYWALREGVECE